MELYVLPSQDDKLENHLALYHWNTKEDKLGEIIKYLGDNRHLLVHKERYGFPQGLESFIRSLDGKLRKSPVELLVEPSDPRKKRGKRGSRIFYPDDEVAGYWKVTEGGTVLSEMEKKKGSIYEFQLKVGEGGRQLYAALIYPARQRNPEKKSEEVHVAGNPRSEDYAGAAAIDDAKDGFEIIESGKFNFIKTESTPTELVWPYIPATHYCRIFKKNDRFFVQNILPGY